MRAHASLAAVNFVRETHSRLCLRDSVVLAILAIQASHRVMWLVPLLRLAHVPARARRSRPRLLSAALETLCSTRGAAGSRAQRRCTGLGQTHGVWWPFAPTLGSLSAHPHGRVAAEAFACKLHPCACVPASRFAGASRHTTHCLYPVVIFSDFTMLCSK